jgi:DNA-binding NarL/FixJ family response regulator
VSGAPPGPTRRYALALAHAFADAAAGSADDVDVPALASYFERRFTREALRLPPDGREEFLSAVALEMLGRIGQPEARGASLAAGEAAFRHATRTVLDTIRHRIARTRTRERRQEGLDDADTLTSTRNGPDVEGLLRRELASRLSAEEMAVLYLATEGQPVGEIARRMSVSTRTIYRALGAIRASLQASRNEDAR